MGSAHFGSTTKDKMVFQLLDQFAEAGGTFIDTANSYASWIKGCVGGESETVIGKWMKGRGNRARMFVATKLGFPYGGSGGGLRAAEIERECEKSLQRLDVETIDLYYVHKDDRDTPLPEVLEAFSRLVSAGKVRLVGASNLAVWRLAESRQLARLNGWPEYCAIEQRYSYLRPRLGTAFTFLPNVVVSDSLLDYCRTNPVTLVAYTVLLLGAYTRSDRPLPEQYVGPDSKARLAVLNAVAAETGATLNQVLIAWLRQSNPPVLPIITASKPAQLTETLGALGVKLSADQMGRLNQAGA